MYRILIFLSVIITFALDEFRSQLMHALFQLVQLTKGSDGATGVSFEPGVQEV